MKRPEVEGMDSDAAPGERFSSEAHPSFCTDAPASRQRLETPSGPFLQ